MIAPLDTVQLLDGRRGLVRKIDGRHVTIVLPTGDEFVDIDDLAPIPEGPVDALRMGVLADAMAFCLRLQALYLRHAYRYDPRSGLSNARIEPKLHRVFIAHRVANKLQAHMILADEVGLGKTI